jgi:hypothetical protein
MAQVTIFGLREQLAPIRSVLSGAIHAAVMDALAYPADKRFHRFILLDREDFLFRTTAPSATRSSRSACSRDARSRRRSG